MSPCVNTPIPDLYFPIRFCFLPAKASRIGIQLEPLHRDLHPEGLSVTLALWSHLLEILKNFSQGALHFHFAQRLSKVYSLSWLVWKNSLKTQGSDLASKVGITGSWETVYECHMCNLVQGVVFPHLPKTSSAVLPHPHASLQGEIFGRLGYILLGILHHTPAPATPTILIHI